MKKIIKGFTLIEILIVISIIAIVSTISISGFFNLTKNNNTKNMLLEISSEIKELDLKIKNYEIFDYEIIFDTNNKNNYIIYENIFNENQNQKVTNQNQKVTNIEDNLIELTLSSLNGELWKYQIYQDIKLIINSNESINTQLNIARNPNYNYKIQGSLELAPNENFLNNIIIKGFDNNNLDLKIEKISGTVDGGDIGYVKIVNIGGKKQFLDNSGNHITYDEIYLHFEEGGRENYLIIDKK